MAYLSRDAYVGRSLDLYGEYGEDELSVLTQMVRPGDIVIEAGANLGSHTVPLARKIGPTGALIAFEPQRFVFQILCANVALNELTNVHAQNAAVGEASGVLEVPATDYAAANNFGGVSLDGVSSAKLKAGAPGEKVPVVTLDSLGLPRVRLIKIDVEGMERAVLAGARETIARCRPSLYFEADRRERNPGLIALAFELGYRLWWHAPPLFSPKNFAGNPNNVFGRIVSLNLLGVPRESNAVIQGLKEVQSADEPTPIG
jgi:FkbM family methyltransferase